jgi:pyruvate,water dikinase
MFGLHHIVTTNQGCRKANKYAGICGQGPSDHHDLGLWLMVQGIDAIL